ncbi:hypothetical protein [Allostreptomyces psammosilenae]|uniref:SH3 domain-containing protein n=1 Tax=Allostreptomyces psammosilenae TaxID=1892865 RepID=A0A852ZYS8_9ACTN|nr:hypothetical protein [Allostreptomyces psammosilenae]NYI03761.1 hypothetical protein [Allostreptomyces psammosilenae]
MPREAFSRATTTAAALLLAAASGIAVPTTATAANSAADCPWTQGAPTRAQNPYEQTDYTIDETPLRVGPYGACDQIYTYAPGEPVTVRCYVTNSYGNTWSYIPGSGWVWDEHLENYGSPHRCVF